ncbi:hypothetical protein E2F50_19920 [Rhizobium deserti]|uniref:Uncharacterized protein n=1 Tax=Rhizobium deserti TaxID=2547961 RepID=A0A4R5U9S9_9HYPH|nr:hypothetical protein [Rhizobium deserti]TDK31222.1 hypothetical protein E2F50_19920 [Rhizobium deserti]
MSVISKQIRSYLAVSAIAVLIAVTALVASASAMSIPDLVFPETVPVPITKPDHMVAGSIPRLKKSNEARKGERTPAAQAVPRERQRGFNEKESQR